MRCVPSIAFQGANRSLFRWHWRLACLPSHPTGCGLKAFSLTKVLVLWMPRRFVWRWMLWKVCGHRDARIGVISHVQEMTERIPVRICVNRAGNGRSFLEVL